tara:strand:+ start:724 stop:1431 length:708 start_codon:yes stop_codon:yes gene_type:complete
MINVDPPFDLGETLKGSQTTVKEDGTTEVKLINTHWEGAIFDFPDVDRTPSIRGGKNRRSGRSIRAVCVRNNSDGALTAASLALKFDITPSSPNAAGTMTASVAGDDTDTAAEWHEFGRQVIGRVDGVTNAVNLFCGIGDDQLTDTVPKHDLFWLIIGGPVLAKLANTQSVAVGVPLASAASGYLADFASGSDAAVAAEAVNVVGRALQPSDATNFDGSASGAGDTILICACVQM